MEPVPGVPWRQWVRHDVILTLLFLAPVFSYLPQSALGALVFGAAIGLVDVGALRVIFSVEVAMAYWRSLRRWR
jgi:Sulfate permease family